MPLKSVVKPFDYDVISQHRRDMDKDVYSAFREKAMAQPECCLWTRACISQIPWISLL